MSRESQRASDPSTEVSSAPDDNTPAAFFEAGLRLLRAGQFQEAERCCRQALAIDAAHADSLHLMGLLSSLAKLERHEEAITWLDKALALRGDFAPALNDRSTSLVALRRIDEAFADIDRAIAVDPECADYHWNKALLQLLTGDFSGWRKAEGAAILEKINRARAALDKLEAA